MKNIRERIESIGCWFEPSKKNYHERWIPHYTIETCEGKGDRNLCKSKKLYSLIKPSRRLWKVACMDCKRKWMI